MSNYKLNKNNQIFAFAVPAVIIGGFLIFSEKTAFNLGLHVGGIIFLLGLSFAVSFITWLLSKKNNTTANKAFAVTLAILVIAQLARFVSLM